MSWVHSAVGEVLTKVLSRYVKDFSSDDAFTASLWNGSLTLSKLELRPELVEALALPVCLSGAYVGEVHIVIPWRSLISKPIEISISHIYALLEPKETSSAYDAVA